MPAIFEARYGRRWIWPLGLALLISGFGLSGAHAETAMLAWDPSAATNVVGYRVYWGGEPGDYTNVLALGNVTTAEIPSLEAGVEYYFAATAVTEAGIESDFSNEALYPPGGINAPPKISAVGTQAILEGTSTAVAFQVSDRETVVTGLSVAAESDNLVLLPASGIQLGGTGTNRTVTLTPTPGRSGTALVTLTASDGSVTSSMAFSLVVVIPPEVDLTAPLAGSTFSAPASIKLSAKVITNESTVYSVSFYRSTTKLGQDSQPAYSYTWKDVPAGTYSLGARVSHDGKFTVSSSRVTVVVTNPLAGARSLSVDSADISYPFSLSGGSIGQSVNTGVDDGGQAIFKVNLSAPSNYVVSAEVSAPNSDGNSFYVSFDRLPVDPKMIWDIPAESDFTRRTVSWRGTGTAMANQFLPRVFTLSAGEHELYVVGRRARTRLRSVIISPVTGLKSPWKSTDVGKLLRPGVGGISGGEYALLSGGVLGSTADSFHFVYQPLSGNGEIRAQVSSLGGTYSSGRVGVMIRESLSTGARYEFLGLSRDGRFRAHRRLKTSGSMGAASYTMATFPDAWVRLKRVGNVFYRYTSTDGTTWDLAATSTNVMATSIQVGLALATGGTSLIGSSVLKNVAVTP